MVTCTFREPNPLLCLVTSLCTQTDTTWLTHVHTAPEEFKRSRATDRAFNDSGGNVSFSNAGAQFSFRSSRYTPERLERHGHSGPCQLELEKQDLEVVFYGPLTEHVTETYVSRINATRACSGGGESERFWKFSIDPLSPLPSRTF